MHYHANTNQPGYLPDDTSTGLMTGSLARALAWLEDELQRDWDAEYEATDELSGHQRADQDAIDARYLEAHTRLHNHTEGPISVAVPGPAGTEQLGRVYWVTECHGSCDWED
jgi:hypothetical protein